MTSTLLVSWLFLGDDAGQKRDFWSKLLGIDRVQIPAGAEWSVNWRHMPPAWVLGLVIVPAILGLVALLYRAERKDVGIAPKAVMTVFRALALMLIAVLLMGPVLTVETIKSRKAYLIVLLDESRSMQKVDLLQTDADREAISRVTGVTGQKEVSQLSRVDLVKKVLENPNLKILDELEEKLNVAYFTFSSTASQKDSRKHLLEEYSKDSCIGTETAIGDAIKSALNSLKGQFIVGVVVFTDGKNNAGIATKEIAAQCKARYLPIYAISSGLPRTPRDIAISELEAPDAVLANNELSVKFKVSSFGYDNEKVQTDLYLYPIKEKDKEPGNDPKELDRLIEESKKEESTETKLDGKKQQAKILFNPKVPGDYLVILRVPPRVDENTPFNNYLVHRLRVADDKIKVLYVEHPPRYEYRFLKNALVRDTKILAHCFLTSADEGFPQEHTKSDDPMFREPLQEFPKDLKSLLEFDVVIFGDVDPGKLGPDAAKHLEQFVSEFGGGIIFISGMMYNSRALVNTPLASLLPVVPDDTRDPYEHEKVYDAIYGYVLTPDGVTSPITNFKQFGGDQNRNLEHWEDRAGRGEGMLGIRWFHRVKKLKAGASPLVEIKGIEGESTRPPLFVTMHAGRGRVFWSATDETWLWRKLVGDYPWFYPFWQQAMYWVREGKLLGARRYRVNVDKDRYTRGEKVKFFASAYDEKYEPKTDPTIEVLIDHPTKTERVRVQLKKDTARDGYYEGDYIPDETGTFKVSAGGEDESSRVSAKFVVFIPDREDDEPILDTDALKEMATESDNGRYFQIDQVDQLNKVIQASRNQIRETKEDDLWDSPLVYLVFALLMTGEWILRKIFRML
jgi:hypothetical protein